MILYALTIVTPAGDSLNSFHLRMADAIKGAKESSSTETKVVKLVVEGRDAFVELLNIASGHIDSLIAGEVVFPVAGSRSRSKSLNTEDIL